MTFSRERQGAAARRDPRRPRRGFTLVELLVVVTIILIMGAASLPVVLPAINSQNVSSAALLLNAELARARDEAVRAGAPRGVRLVPEREGRFAWGGATPGYTQLIALEMGPDYHEGAIRLLNPAPLSPDLTLLFGTFRNDPQYDMTLVGSNWRTVWESKHQAILPGPPPIGLPRSPTSWYWNVRQGDRLRVHSTGRVYTIVGPMLVGPYLAANQSNVLLSASDRQTTNPERYVNWGSPASFSSTPSASVVSPTATEFLILLDGIDNDFDGYVDEAFDGLDNDGDGVIDPGFNGLDDDGDGRVDEPDELFFNGGGEAEIEATIVLPAGLADGVDYTIERRPVPARQARALTLPAGVVIDMTTWNRQAFAVQERSRLPVDPATGHVDVMIAPNGQIMPQSATVVQNGATAPGMPFYHFWITDADDVFEPDATLNPPAGGPPYQPPQLPYTESTPGYTPTNAERVLQGNRRLVTVNTRTGQITTTSLELFDLTGLSLANPDTREFVMGRPYRQAEQGVKEQP